MPELSIISDDNACPVWYNFCTNFIKKRYRWTDIQTVKKTNPNKSQALIINRPIICICNDLYLS